MIPDLTVPSEESQPVGLYGRMWVDNMKKQHPGIYSSLIVEGKLSAQAQEIDRTANERIERIVKSMAEKDGTNEELKARDQMRWVGLMNNYKHSAEEIMSEDTEHRNFQGVCVVVTKSYEQG